MVSGTVVMTKQWFHEFYSNNHDGFFKDRRLINPKGDFECILKSESDFQNYSSHRITEKKTDFLKVHNEMKGKFYTSSQSLYFMKYYVVRLRNE